MKKNNKRKMIYAMLLLTSTLLSGCKVDRLQKESIETSIFDANTLVDEDRYMLFMVDGEPVGMILDKEDEVLSKHK